MNSAIPKIENEPLLPVRMLNEFIYCPRLFYLEWVQGEFEDSEDTIVGQRIHKRISEEKGDIDYKIESCDERKIRAQSVLLSSEKLGIIARIDLIEKEKDKLIPIDYKKGSSPDTEDGVWYADRIQVCAQVLILRENNYQCEEGFIYYDGNKKRVEIKIDDNLINQTKEMIKKAKEISKSGKIPPPLIDSSKCPRCSLVGICLPDETNLLLRQNYSENIGSDTEVRRLLPARADTLPVYILDQGAIITKKGNELDIRVEGKSIQTVRLLEISTLNIFGNVQITTQAIRELCDYEIPICYFTYGGWFYAITHGLFKKNIELRLNQYRTGLDRDKCREIAKRFVIGKIKNCRTILRRNSDNISRAALNELSRLAKVAERQDSLEALYGVEGAASRVYFSHFTDMIKVTTNKMKFDFKERNRRPPKDPINALLSFAYALLTRSMTVCLFSVGFDPYFGFFHQPRFGRPSLALDLMEEFRPIVADSVVLTLVNNNEISENDFIYRAGAVALTEDGKKKVIRAYERRLDTLIQHPIFEYTISYRRVFEVQARLLGRYLNGEISEYPIFLTR
jgi:CRISPR-associated protein Cas1